MAERRRALIEKIRVSRAPSQSDTVSYDLNGHLPPDW